MIGTELEAEFIVNNAEYYEPECLDYYEPPPGWQILGGGSYRTCFLSPFGFVYKLTDELYENHNESEYINYKRIRNQPLRGWGIPETNLFYVADIPVIAMEFVKGKHDWDCGRYDPDYDYRCTCPYTYCVYDKWEKAADYWDITDVHSGNIILRRNKRYLIDLSTA